MWVLLLSSAAIQVTLHLKRIIPRSNVMHAGISFRSAHRAMRFDFGPSKFDARHIGTWFARRGAPEQTVDVAWGATNRTWPEIVQFERDVLRRRRYLLGVYDCRHYVRDFADWSVGEPTPVWRLEELWEEEGSRM